MKKYAIITGAGTGIGRALALELAKENIHVIAVGRREACLKAVQAEAPQWIQIVNADVSQATEREKIVKALPQNACLSYLVHNAGTVDPIVNLERIQAADLRQAFATNFEAPLFLTQALLPRLSYSRVLHISSGLAHIPLHGFGAYCTSKAALFMLYQVFKTECRNKNIYFGSVMPGVVDTPILTHMRTLHTQDFPGQDFFINLKKENKLVPVETCGAFLRWLLLQTSHEEFSAKEWDIYETTHHHRWLGNLYLPIPDFD